MCVGELFTALNFQYESLRPTIERVFENMIFLEIIARLNIKITAKKNRIYVKYVNNKNSLIFCKILTVLPAVPCGGCPSNQPAVDDLT